jgi:hypothetical protein
VVCDGVTGSKERERVRLPHHKRSSKIVRFPTRWPLAQPVVTEPITREYLARPAPFPTHMKKSRPLPELQYLHECFVLDLTCASGLRWKTRPGSHANSPCRVNSWNSKYAGTPAGKVWTSPRDGKQYFKVSVGDTQYMGHRIVYSMLNNEDLDCDTEIDHIDGNGLNNVITNLRKATCSQNCQNAKIRADNTSGIKGVSWNKVRKLWHAYVRVDGVRYQQYFEHIEDAQKFVTTLRPTLHLKFTNHG